MSIKNLKAWLWDEQRRLEQRLKEQRRLEQRLKESVLADECSSLNGSLLTVRKVMGVLNG